MDKSELVEWLLAWSKVYFDPTSSKFIAVANALESTIPKPIKTAPKDGTWVDLWVGSERFPDGVWADEMWWWGWDGRRKFLCTMPPTHWTPIPNGPKEEEGHG